MILQIGVVLGWHLCLTCFRSSPKTHRQKTSTWQLIHQNAKATYPRRTSCSTPQRPCWFVRRCGSCRSARCRRVWRPRCWWCCWCAGCSCVSGRCPCSRSRVRRKEGNILFTEALNTFYLRLYGVRHMVKDHSDSEKRNPLPPHRLLLSINSKGSFICIIPQTE